MNGETRKKGETRMKRSKIIPPLVVLGMMVTLLALAVVPRQARAADITQMITAAKTAQDHKAIAAYYEQQAADARAQVAKHTEMEKSYENSTEIKSAGPDFLHVFVGHCKAMVNYYRKIAKEDAALAKEHLAMAQKLSK
jgi:hypothetical protein